MKEFILSQLKLKYKESLFLPAHCLGSALPQPMRQLMKKRAGIWDLPELPSLGGPLEQYGAVAESQQAAAKWIGADNCWYGVNGATGLLQAALLAIARPGEGVLLPRNAHRSLIQACLLGDVTPFLFDLPFQKDRGQPAPPDEEWMKNILSNLPSNCTVIRAAVLVHPTYQGYANDPGPLIKLLQSRGWAVLVDEAHGSHFATCVDQNMPPSALHCGADLVVHSLQKSAAGLAQTAVLWQQGNRVDPDAVRRSIGWLQTTSPSTLLLASCETAIAEWQTSKGINRLMRRISEAIDIAEHLRQKGIPLLQTQDPLRLVLHTGAIGISGIYADNWLIKRGIVGELPEPATITLCLGLAKHRGLKQKIVQVWRSLLSTHSDREPQQQFEAPPLPTVSQPEIPLRISWRSSNKLLPLQKAKNYFAAELICPYPPGIPMLIPGEKLDGIRLGWILRQQELWGEQIPKHIRVMT